MDDSLKEKALKYLQTLVDKPLCYGIKSPDMELYGFGFGEWVSVPGKNNQMHRKCTHIIHVLCNFEVIWRNGRKQVDKYYDDTPHEKFHLEIQKLLGLTVKRVGLGEFNDLWLDLGDFWIVFTTDDGGEESWRFFMSDSGAPHLVASDTWLDYDTDDVS